ncbi:glycosyltransferase family 2 protein [bacterium]|nr:glycosyltransferase family 2 protein [bacterium]
MSTPDLDISLIIVHRNGVQLLRDCLQSLPAACAGITWEAIVVDNGSTDGSPEMVEKEFPEARLIPNKDNAGFTRANNQGLEIARGRYLVLLNNDTEALPDAFAKAVEYLDANTDVGTAGLKLLNPDRSRQLSCRRFPTFQQALFNRYSLLTRLFPNNPYSANYLMSDIEDDKIHDVDWVSGACLIARREVYDSIGGLDERFFMYSEDVDYCLRVWQARYRVIYLPIASVVHYIGQTSAKYPFMPILSRHRSMYRFYKKHYSRELIFLDVATAGMVTTRCVLQLVSVFFRRLGRKTA